MMNDFKELAKFQFESSQARLERIIKLLWALCLLLVVLLVATNGAWLYYESQFSTQENTVIKQEVDGSVVADGIHIEG